MNTLVKADVLGLSLSERVQLVEDIWDSILEMPEALALTEPQKVELDARLAAYHRNPAEGKPWGLVREQFAKRP